MNIPVALTIAGSDSSAGAGIQADLKTFSALDVYGVCAVTCVVAEMPGKVVRLEPVSLDLVRAQIETLLAGFRIAAIKTGLLFSGENISAIVDLVARIERKIPIVVDPVMVATSGDRLLRDDAVKAYETELFPRATLITPNLDEAANLLGQKIPDREAMERAARALGEKYGTSILLKGGHLSGANALDLLFSAGKISEFSAPFSHGVATHGTGCTYSAAITAGLARGLSLHESIARAKKFVSAAVAQHHRWKTSHGANIDALNHSPGAAPS